MSVPWIESDFTKRNFKDTKSLKQIKRSEKIFNNNGYLILRNVLSKKLLMSNKRL